MLPNTSSTQPSPTTPSTRLTYTRTGARRSGDDYQDIIALEFMVEWLENPRRYTRMVLEDDDEDNEFLDDVRLDRNDGTTVVRQVKFAVHPEHDDDAWTWKTLLEQRQGKERTKGPNKGTRAQLPSLFQKWANTWRQLTASDGASLRQVDAAVVSNRRASSDFAASLKSDGFVDFDLIASVDVRQQIIQQIGDEPTARAFFAGFRFQLEYPSLEGKEEELLRRVQAFRLGRDDWNNLQAELRSWIRHRELPPPDGSITLSEIRHALRWYQLQSLPQDFVIPSDYVWPDKAFHDNLRDTLLALDGECRVLTASPGAGKSTYCSTLYEELRKSGIPVVRHHYFLSLSDPRATYSALERLDHRRAAESLMHDLLWEHGNALSGLGERNPRPEDLREWLSSCGRHYQGQGKKLVVILDGLDHIWREAGSIEELRQLLDYLLPVPPGVVVLMATQPVQDDKLPLSLLSYAPRDQWFRLPFLHQESIRKWLIHHKSEIWPEESIGEESEHTTSLTRARSVDFYQLDQLSQAFYDKSKGHPLHLRYSLKALQDHGESVTTFTVEELPPCPHEDINEYYRLLYARLGDEGRFILHLLATSRFSWPREGIIDCVAQSPFERPRIVTALRDVEHLLVSDELGLRPFHGSLLVWLQSQGDHPLYAESLRAQIIGWLSSKAPEAWRWAYEWMLRADAGEVTPLRDGPNRDWAIEAVAKRRSGHETSALLLRSGWHNLENHDLPRALEVGLLSDYIHNTFSYSGYLLEPLLLPQLIVEEDLYLRSRLYAAHDGCSDIELSLLSEAEWRRGDIKRINHCFSELVHRLNTNRSRNSEGKNAGLDEASEAIVRVAAQLPVVDDTIPLGESEVERVLDFALRQSGISGPYSERPTIYSTKIISNYARCIRIYNNVGAFRRALRLTRLEALVESTEGKSDIDLVEVADLSDVQDSSDEVYDEGAEKEGDVTGARRNPYNLRMTFAQRRLLLRDAVWLALEKDLNFNALLEQDRKEFLVSLYFLVREHIGGLISADALERSEPIFEFEWPDAKILTLSENDTFRSHRNIEEMFYETFFVLLVNSWSGRDEENQRQLAALKADTGKDVWPLLFLERLHTIVNQLVPLIKENKPISFAWFFEQLQLLARPYYVGYIREKTGHYGFSARHAAGRIGHDLWILLRSLGLSAPQISLQEFRQALDSDYLVAETWLDDINDLRRGVFSSDDGLRYLQEERENLDAQVTEFDERTKAWTRLATFAALHDLRDEAQLLIRRASGCLVAHYCHKETSLFNLLDALRTLYIALNSQHGYESAESAKQVVRDCLLQIGPIIAKADQFTDGDETGHLPEELSETLQVVAPAWLADYFVFLHEEEDFQAAEAAFKDWLRSANLGEVLQKSIASTALSIDEINVLQARATQPTGSNDSVSGDDTAGSILSSTIAFCGNEALPQHLKEDAATSLLRESTLPSPADYPPSRIEEFFEELRRAGVYTVGREIDEWAEHWEVTEPEAAINALKATLESHSHRGGWDALFGMVHRHNGIEEAYSHLVKAHREAGGWYFYFSSREESQERWRQVRALYPEKWFDFLLDTTRGEKVPWEGARWRSVALGYSTWAHLVEYLVLHEQFDAAIKSIQRMTTSMLEATSPVPLSEPAWVAYVQGITDVPQEVA